jgi:hypothetical protein
LIEKKVFFGKGKWQKETSSEKNSLHGFTNAIHLLPFSLQQTLRSGVLFTLYGSVARKIFKQN